MRDFEDAIRKPQPIIIDLEDSPEQPNVNRQAAPRPFQPFCQLQLLAIRQAQKSSTNAGQTSTTAESDKLSGTNAGQTKQDTSPAQFNSESLVEPRIEIRSKRSDGPGNRLRSRHQRRKFQGGAGFKMKALNLQNIFFICEAKIPSIQQSSRAILLYHESSRANKKSPWVPCALVRHRRSARWECCPITKTNAVSEGMRWQLLSPVNISSDFGLVDGEFEIVNEYRKQFPALKELIANPDVCRARPTRIQTSSSVYVDEESEVFAVGCRREPRASFILHSRQACRHARLICCGTDIIQHTTHPLIHFVEPASI